MEFPARPSNIALQADRRVLVYQMGKVGSQSVVRSLETMKLGMPIEHVHFLNDLDTVEKNMKDSWFRSGAQMVHLNHCRSIRAQLDSPDRPVHWYVITLVRDPIAREASAFFYNLDLVTRRWLRTRFLRRLHFRLLNPEKLRRRFLDQINLDGGSYWFNTQFLPVFGIDLLAEPFPAERGFNIYRRNSLDILLLKLEQIQECGGQAIKEFLGADGFVISQRNRADRSSYSENYQKFLKVLKPTQGQLDQAYNSPPVQRFYSVGQIEKMRARWD